MRTCRYNLLVVLTLFAIYQLISPVGQAYSATWKAAMLAPKGTYVAKAFEEIVIPGISRASNKQLQLKVYYGAQMGDEDAYIKKMKSGELQCAIFNGDGLLNLCPEFSVVQLPFIFSDFDQVDRLREHGIETFDTLFWRHGFKLLYWLDYGFEHIYSLNNPMASFADFRRERFINASGIIEAMMFYGLNMQSVPAKWSEADSLLKKSLTGSIISDPIWIVKTQSYSIIHYINAVNFRYRPCIVTVSAVAWQGLSPDVRQSLDASRNVIQSEANESLRKDYNKVMEALIKYGIKKVSFDPASEVEIREAAIKTWPSFSEDIYTGSFTDGVIAVASGKALTLATRGSQAAAPDKPNESGLEATYETSIGILHYGFHIDDNDVLMSPSNGAVGSFLGFATITETEAIEISDAIYASSKADFYTKKVSITLVQDKKTGKWLATAGKIGLFKADLVTNGNIIVVLLEGQTIRIIGGKDKPIKILGSPFSDTTVVIREGKPVEQTAEASEQARRAPDDISGRYIWKSKWSSMRAGKGFWIRDEKGGTAINLVEQGKGSIPMIGGELMIDLPGTTDVHVQIDPAVGKTTYAGLTFSKPCVVDILKDGTVITRQAGTLARDQNGKIWISEPAVVEGINGFAFFTEASAGGSK